MKTVKKVVKKVTKKAQVGYSIGMHSTKDAKGNIDRLDRFKNAQGEDRYYRSTGTDIDALGKFNKTKAMLNRADSVRSNTLTPREREVMASQVNPMKNGGKTVKKTVKKAQNGRDVPKGYVRGEMTGKLYKKEVMDKWDKGVNESLDKAAGTGKYAPKKNTLSNTAAKKKMKSGGKMMMKRADGSVSQHGLWDNIRAAKGSGKKPTAAMLKQEKKIKSTSKKK